MGIESDQLVYDYLSRVGDLAQQQQLSSGARMRLVATLRGEIDRQRATEGADSPAAVRRIIGRLGSPDQLVGAAAESGDGTVPLPSARTGAAPGGQRRSVPRPRSGLLRREPREPKETREPREPREPRESRESKAPAPRGSKASAPEEPHGPMDPGGPRARKGLRKRPRGTTGAEEPGKATGPKAGFGWGASRREPRDGTAAGGGTGAEGTPSAGPGATAAPEDVPAFNWPHPSAPHVLGPGPGRQSTGEDDWWRLEPGPFDAGTAIPGFFGGIEAPELLGRRPKHDAPEAEGDEAEDDGTGAEEDGDTEEAAPRRALRIPRPRRREPVAVAGPVVAAAPAPRGGFAHPLLLLAAVLLLAGVATGSWIPLAGGWLIAYGSRSLSRTEAKWAALGLPGAVAAGALVWVWGRMDGRWGEPIVDGALREVLVGAWPVVVRVAAVASALYLVWRARRRA